MRFSVAEVLDEAWRLYTRHSGRLIVVAAVVFGFLSLVQALVNSTGQRALVAVSVGVTIVGAFWLQGALVVVADDLRDGRIDLSIGEVFRRVEPRLWTLIVVGLLAGIGVAAGTVLFVIPGLILITYWSLVIPAVVVERRGIFDSFSRSWRLVSGDALRVFTVVVITVVLATVVSLVITALLQPLPDFVDLYVAGVIANSVTVPFVALAWTLMYFELRAIKG